MSNFFDIYRSLRSPLTDPDFLPDQAEVLLRADLNVPLVHGKITDDFRLQALLPTLEVLIKQQSHVRLVTHIGQPEEYDPTLSTQPLEKWLKKQGYPIATKKKSQGAITVEENVRFDKREHEQDVQYAYKLMEHSHYYLNDAFGSAHRSDTSLTTLAEQFDHDKRGIGLLMQHELSTLGAVRVEPKRPVVMVLGGGKISKLKLAVPLLDYVDTLLLCPALGPIVSLFHLHEVQDEIQHLAASAKTHVPLDYLVSTTYPWQSPFHVAPAKKVSTLSLAVSIGPETTAAWQPILEQAGTIIFNGPMGEASLPESQVELQKLLTIIANSSAYSVIGGGDSLHALDMFNLSDKVSYRSTGGGSMLTYLAQQPLPALDVLRI